MGEDDLHCTACGMDFATERGYKEHRMSIHGDGRRRRHQD